MDTDQQVRLEALKQAREHVFYTMQQASYAAMASGPAGTKKPVPFSEEEVQRRVETLADRWAMWVMTGVGW